MFQLKDKYPKLPSQLKHDVLHLKAFNIMFITVKFTKKSDRVLLKHLVHALGKYIL